MCTSPTPATIVCWNCPAGSPAPTELPFGGLRGAGGVAVDTAGNVYVTSESAVLELPAGWTAPSELPFSGLKAPNAVAVDTNGNVYVTDAGNNRVGETAAENVAGVWEQPWSNVDAVRRGGDDLMRRACDRGIHHGGATCHVDASLTFCVSSVVRTACMPAEARMQGIASTKSASY
jgi:hypothetical protein